MSRMLRHYTCNLETQIRGILFFSKDMLINYMTLVLFQSSMNYISVFGSNNQAFFICTHCYHFHFHLLHLHTVVSKSSNDLCKNKILSMHSSDNERAVCNLELM